MDFTNLRALVIGDICLDIITNGESTRLSPECPVPVIKNPYKTYSLGMAANVAVNLNNLGCSVDILTFVGNDKQGTICKQLMLENNFLNNIYVVGQGSTIVKNRILANGHQVTRLDTEESPKINLESLNMINLECKYDFIIISDYDKGFITNETWQRIYNIINVFNKGEIFVDTKKKDVLDFYEGMILFPNSLELKGLMNYYCSESPEQLRVELDSELLIETASERGAYAYNFNGVEHSPAIEHEVIDVTGAGDTFIAAFSAYYTKTQNVKKSLEFANYCCSKVVVKKGTIPIQFKEALMHDFNSEQ